MPERVVADGSRKVITGNARTRCRYTARLRPRACPRIDRARRSARPLRTTATPIVRTPTRKYGTGLAKPCSAGRIPSAAPVSARSTIASSAVTPGSSASVVHSTMIISVTRSARWPAPDRPSNMRRQRTAPGRGCRAWPRARGSAPGSWPPRPLELGSCGAILPRDRRQRRVNRLGAMRYTRRRAQRPGRARCPDVTAADRARPRRRQLRHRLALLAGGACEARLVLLGARPAWPRWQSGRRSRSHLDGRLRRRRRHAGP